jgi:hypothetical protein
MGALSSQADAEKRVADAKTAADSARKAAAKLLFSLTAAMLFGAFAAGLAAVEGGSLRDVPGTTVFSHHDTYRSLSWVEEFFSGCSEYRFQSSFCLRFSGIRLHQSPNQIHIG